MPKRELHPSGDTIIFTERYHQYKSLLQPSQKFTSGTKFLGNFFGKFDSERISKIYGAKHNMDPKDVRAMWSRKGEIGREVGTIIHWYLEQQLLGEKTTHDQAAVRHPDPEIQAAARLKFEHADAALADFLERYEVLKIECIVASLEYWVAGMIDILCRNKANGNICFADWKTNAKIDYTNNWQSGTGVISHIDDCSFQKYRLQLGLYEYIAVDEGYLTGEDAQNIERVLIHIRNDGHTFIPCPAIQKEIGLMLNS